MNNQYADELNFDIPPCPVPDEIPQLEVGKKYRACLGIIFPTFKDLQGNKVDKEHPEAAIDSIGQEIWLLDNIMTLPDGSIEFIGKPRQIEYMALPNNRNFKSIAWKNRAFYDAFDALKGEKGHQEVDWEKVRTLTGQRFTLSFEKKGDYTNLNLKSISLAESGAPVLIEHIRAWRMIYNKQMEEREALKKAGKEAQQPVEDFSLDVPF
jgi:hypothetical protein